MEQFFVSLHFGVGVSDESISSKYLSLHQYLSLSPVGLMIGTIS